MGKVRITPGLLNSRRMQPIFQFSLLISCMEEVHSPRYSFTSPAAHTHSCILSRAGKHHIQVPQASAHANSWLPALIRLPNLRHAGGSSTDRRTEPPTERNNPGEEPTTTVPARLRGVQLGCDHHALLHHFHTGASTGPPRRTRTPRHPVAPRSGAAAPPARPQRAGTPRDRSGALRCWLSSESTLRCAHRAPECIRLTAAALPRSHYLEEPVVATFIRGR